VDITAEAINDFARAEAEGLPMHNNHGAFDTLPAQSRDLLTTLAWGRRASFSILDEATITAAWEASRHHFLAAWQKYLPGKRPAAWWEFDAPDEERREVGVVDEFEGHKLPYDDPIYETEAKYRRRHHLLTVEEEAALRGKQS
jgi:hypothetical protein